jgi:hypothetical protein
MKIKCEIVAVEPTSADEAKSRFREWAAEHRHIAERLCCGDIIVDIFRAEEGQTLYRYRVFSEGYAV